MCSLACATVRTPLDPPPVARPPVPAPPSPLFHHVLIIVLENQDYAKARTDPYLQLLAQAGFNLADFHALFHPSYPNYLAMISGKELATAGDRQQDYPDRTIADLLEPRGLTWKNYAEDYPGQCFTGSRSGRYARKHVPFLSFTRIRTTACGQVVPATGFERDRASGDLPTYMFYSPNLDNDGHDPVLRPATGLRKSTRWLRSFLEPLRADSAFMRRTLVVITYDESRSDPVPLTDPFHPHARATTSPNQIYTVLLGGGVRVGSSDRPLTHFDLLRTVEWNFGLPPLAAGDSTASPIVEAWSP